MRHFVVTFGFNTSAYGEKIGWHEAGQARRIFSRTEAR
jgi:hypothetical protein